ncbi:MAG: tetratricopeptide repeat protein [Caldilineaceae bacterium]
MSKLLKATLCGAPILTLGEQPLTGLITGKALALFVYLAVTGQPHSRDMLADLLWSELANQQARNNLRYVLSDLRQVVGDYLTITPQRIRFNQESPYWLDVEALRTTLAAKPATVDLPAWQAALDLYQGEFLADFTVRNAPRFMEWLQQERAALHQLVVHGLSQLAEGYLQQGNHAAGLATTQRLLQLAPLYETGHRLQMALLAQSGQRAAALAHLGAFEQRLAAELGVTPEAESHAFYEGLLAEEQAHLAPAATAPAPGPRHNLPGQLTPFIGRTGEIATIRATLLEPQQRLITLVGEGGIGKTRLALAIAHQVQDDFPDGIWFVPLIGLAPTADLPDRLAGAIATAVQLSFSGQVALSIQLFKQLQTKQSLLILDSFEHLLDGADFILELLRNTNAVKILVTSRHILNFQAEYAWRVEGLAAPQPAYTESLSPEMLLHYDSVALFVERARRVVRGFTLTEQNQYEVARICQFVQGLPLGTELAAALTRHYTCAEIAQALDQNYAILATAQRDIQPRHRSIEATLAYSWSFLSEPEARIVAQCSVFRGGFSREAAEQIMGATRSELDALEDQSLLRLVRGTAGQSRYEMHELVRQYAARQLQSSPALVQATRTRFCTYYTNFIAARVEALVQDQQAVREMQADLNNVRQTWQWITDLANVAALAKSSDGLFRFFYIMGMYQEGESAARTAVQALHGLLAASPVAEADQTSIRYELVRGLLTQARFCERLARLEEAERLTQEGVQRAHALGFVELEARGCLGLAALAQIRFDNLTMRRMGEKMLALVEGGGFSPTEGVRMKSYGLKYLGIYGVYSGDYQQALTCFDDGLRLAQQIQDRELETMLVNNLGVVHGMMGAFSQAIHCYQQTLAISRSLGERNGAGLALINLGEIYHALGDWEEAKDQIGQALALYHEVGYQFYEAKAWARLGRIAHALGNDIMAHSYLEQAMQIAQAAGLQTMQAEFLTDLGAILIGLHRFAEAEAVYRQALAGWQQTGAVQQGWRVQAGLAQVALLQNQRATASGYVEEILQTLEHAPFNALYEPLFVYLLCYRVLAATGDRRAHELLRRGYNLLQVYAEQIDDSGLRRSFLENIVFHREIIGLARQAGLTHA